MSRYVPENVKLGSSELQKKYGLEESYRYYLDKEEKADREFKGKADPLQAAPINKGGRPKKLIEKALSMLNRNGKNNQYEKADHVKADLEEVEEAAHNENINIESSKKELPPTPNPLKSRGCEFEQTSRPTKVPSKVAKNFPTANQSQYIKSLVVSCSYYVDKIYRMRGLDPYSKIKEYDYMEYASRFKAMKRVHTLDSVSEIITDLHILRDKLREITSSKADLRPLNRNEMALYMKLKARVDVPGVNELNKIIRGIK